MKSKQLWEELSDFREDYWYLMEQEEEEYRALKQEFPPVVVSKHHIHIPNRKFKKKYYGLRKGNNTSKHKII